MKTLGTLAVVLLALLASARAAGCDNPYFPAKAGSSKTFQGKGKSYTISVTNVTANGFTLRYEYTNPVLTLELPVTCTAEGLSVPALGAGSSFGYDAKVSTEIKQSSGIVIPTAERWKVGSSWTFSNEGTVTVKDKQQGQLVYSYKGQFTFRVVGQEQVKVPAGTFQAFKVVLTQKGEFSAKGTSQPINYTFTQWFSKGVGLVRQEDIVGVQELVSYK